MVLVLVPRVSRSCEHIPDGFDLHLLQYRRVYPTVGTEDLLGVTYNPLTT